MNMKNKSLLFVKLFMMCFLVAFTFISNAAGFKGAQEKMLLLVLQHIQVIGLCK